MEELFPLGGGFLIGAIFGLITSPRRRVIALLLGAVVAFLATVLSGEFEASWGFLLVDGSIVLGSALVGFIFVHHLRMRLTRPT